MKCKCTNCPAHVCYTKGINCTSILHAEVKAAYTEEELKLRVQNIAIALPVPQLPTFCPKKLKCWLNNIPKLYKQSKPPSASINFRASGGIFFKLLDILPYSNYTYLK